MKLDIEAISDVGLKRQQNEDMILIGNEYFRNTKEKYSVELHSDSIPYIVAVSDGLGGHNAGEIASEIVMHNVSQFVMQLPHNLNINELKTNITRLFQNLHSYIIGEGKTNPSLNGMGATFVGLLFYNLRIFLINVGDSRCYRFRGGFLRQISKDHTLSSLYNQQHNRSHVLINSVGGGENIFIDFEDITDIVSNEDTFLLCSDGLSDMLPDDIIEGIINSSFSASNLVLESKTAGGRDNISVVLMRISDLYF